jgi:hypothetical protein
MNAAILKRIESMLAEFVEFMFGGKSAGKKTEVDEKELAAGIEVEKEHTSSARIAEKICRDHLAENPSYYTKLKAAGL